MLWSPSPELARVVLPFTDDGGPVASLDARQTNFNVHVEFLLDLDFPFFSLCCLCPNSLRCSKAMLGEAPAPLGEAVLSLSENYLQNSF